MRVVFMGTPQIAATILESLAAAHDVVGVYTRPDAVSGRGNKAVPSPVKAVATARGIPVVETKTLRNEDVIAGLRALEPDVVCVSAFGAILPKEVLDIPRLGCINAHASLLPRWRGAAPIERAILAGDERTGVCIMRMEEGLDTGAYCVRKETSVGEKAADELTGELAVLGAEALIEALADLEAGRAVWTEQGEAGVTYAEKIAKHELNVGAGDTCTTATRKVRAASEAHASRMVLDKRAVSLIRVSVASDDDAVELCASLEAGNLVFRHKRLFAKMVDGIMEIIELKPDSKNEMSAKAFCAGIQSAKTKIMNWESI